MTSLSTVRSAAIGASLVASLLVLGSVSAVAQTAPGKPPLRLPPNSSQTNQIPAGVDTGTPATSDSLTLGTQVPPANAADKGDLRTKSAAARMAARTSSTSRRAGVRSDCASPSRGTSMEGSVADAGVSAGPAEAMAARAGARPQNGKPSALPNSGFLGAGNGTLPTDSTGANCP